VDLADAEVKPGSVIHRMRREPGGSREDTRSGSQAAGSRCADQLRVAVSWCSHPGTAGWGLRRRAGLQLTRDCLREELGRAGW